MRCLGRLVAGFLLLIALGLAWLYRDDLGRWIDNRLHPGIAALRTGRPSIDGLAAAMLKLDALRNHGLDSVVVSAGEFASLLAHGVSFLPGSSFDSLTIELGDREVRIRTVIDSALIPPHVRELIPGHRPFEVVTARGSLTPVRAGEGELQWREVKVRGVPLPASLVARAVAELTGGGGEGRLAVTFPPAVGGFRVRPEGVTIYHGGAP
ncbi:MAG: hypothetical protein ACREL5_12970 [Gemmatimonadales bacterium]